MASNINLNLNQSPYFDDYDETKDFHQVLYKPAVAVQARELSQEQTILRNQLKRFGDHIFANGSRVSGGEIHLDKQYSFVKLQTIYNAVDITPSLFSGKTIIGSTSGTKAVVVNYAVVNATTGDPVTLWIKYISGGAVTEKVQGIKITAEGSGYTTTPAVSITGGGGSGATAVAVVGAAQNIIGINITAAGSGYTSTPTVAITGGGGTSATATATLNTSPAFSNSERIVATDFSVSALVATSSATGTGSAISNDEGYYYFNGNFVRVGAQTLILDNYTNTPSYRIGMQVTAEIVDSGDDSTLLDNAQGAYNYAAPGADRLKYSLTLTKKTTDSTDDIDFIEMLRLVDGERTKEIKYPVYSVLADTFARRTYDESGSYTVRHFPLQLKDHSSDATKFIAKIDPGKAYVFGVEYETLVSTDLEVDRARDFRNVNGFDRLMQYGNYTIVKTLTGGWDISSDAVVDLHNNTSITLTNPSTYATTKVGTARVRQLTYSSGTTPTNYIFKMYLYDVTMTAGDYASVERIVIPESPLSGTVALNADCLIDDTGKVGGTSGGDAKLFETNFNTMFFKLSQDVIKTIRDGSGNIDTSYTIQRVFKDVQINSGASALASGGSTETFYGTGVLSDTIKKTHYHAVVKTAGNSGLAVGAIINYEGAASGVITVAGNGQSVVLNTGQSGHTYTADFIATMNVDTKQEKTKTLVSNYQKNITSPGGGVNAFTSLDISDVNTIHAIYDSGSGGTDALPPTLTVSSASGTFLAGETITGGTSGATGVVIDHSTATIVKFVVTAGTFAGTETITGGTNSYTATMVSLAAGDTVITDRYILDTGQRDNFYGHGRLQLSGTAATGRILVIMDYFTHSGTGYFSVDSYTASGLPDSYADIPSYTSPISGTKFQLRDCIDFRPRLQDGSGSTSMQNGEIPYPNLNWQADYSYYLPRTDAVYVSKDLKFGTYTGRSRELPIPPVQMNGTMSLWMLKIPAYTFDTKDIDSVYLENRRYTMQDIAGIDKRVKRIEYYTSLSLLEKDAEALVIKDTAGLDRFKNGILVDAFKGHSIGNVLDGDYKCSIDFPAQELRPSFNSNIVDLSYVSGSSTGVQKTGDLITLPYTSAVFASQTQVSKAINVNPFNVLQWIGTCDLAPAGDNWVATNNAPDVLINKGENDAWEAFARNLVQGFGTQWSDWETQSSITTNVQEIASRPAWQTEWFTSRDRISTRVQTTTENQTRQGVQLSFTGVDTINTSIGDRVRDVSIMPYIRAQNITVTLKGLKPNTRLYPFFDATDIASYCTPSGGSLGGTIYTDDVGSTTFLFALPCPVHAQRQTPPLLIFRTGERQLLVTDNSTGNKNTASTFAEAMFHAQGLMQTKENVILSSRVPLVSSRQLTDSRTISATNMIEVDVPAPVDPLAQTFFVVTDQFPEGVCLTSVDLYFKTKDDNMPVMVDIVTTETGFPSQTVVPFSEVVKNPADVNVSATGATKTTFTFSGPIYLMPGEYAIRIRTNCVGYEAWVGEMGENLLGTTRKISKQPHTGVLFKSQNASTWDQDQNLDLAFVLNRAEYTISGTHEAVFQNDAPASDYKMDVADLIPRTIEVHKTNVSWNIKTTLQSTGNLNSDYENITADVNHEFDNQQVVTTTVGSLLTKAVLSSTSAFVSPIIDTQLNSLIAIENIINNLSTNEAELPKGGDATARYITRRVTLKDGFDARDLTAYLTINKRAGTDVKCYYKILSQYDPTPFHDCLWKPMSQTDNLNTISLDADEFIEYQFDPTVTAPYVTAEAIQYTDGSATYSSYKTFAVKVVMNSTNTSVVPRIKDLRVIALA